jgi:hypothetical protein
LLGEPDRKNRYDPLVDRLDIEYNMDINYRVGWFGIDRAYLTLWLRDHEVVDAKVTAS